ncbi:MAG TPA: class I SAM-dependent methyltransferase, partial [Dehalococcoidia bacterium]|nr:class I SAM-dependent methyltransferase [Dehalococcoidia bacterium]
MTENVRRVDPLEGYERWAATYDTTPDPVVSLDSRHSVRVLSVESGELILDAGCGTGRNLSRMREEGARPVGIDFSPAMLRSAHRRVPDVPLAAADLQSPLPFRDATFDAVLCSLVGEHLARLEFALGELRRVLKVGGRLVFSVYHPQLAAAGAG